MQSLYNWMDMYIQVLVSCCRVHQKVHITRGLSIHETDRHL